MASFRIYLHFEGELEKKAEPFFAFAGELANGVVQVYLEMLTEEEIAELQREAMRKRYKRERERLFYHHMKFKIKQRVEEREKKKETSRKTKKEEKPISDFDRIFGSILEGF